MINKDFYPTPAAVIIKMLSGIHDLDSRYILEPSAGKGDILDHITKVGRYGSYRNAENVAAVESDPELQATLRGKGYTVLASDFLTFHPSNYFDFIVMNPPFAAGVDHLLHAWDILQGGDIVCLLNAETILNPSTEKRKLLARIIEENGGYEILGDVFRQAERKTGVNVALVRLHKKQNLSAFEFHEETRERQNSLEDEPSFELTSVDKIQDIVDRYEAAKASFADLWRAYHRTGAYTSGVLDADKQLLEALGKGGPVQGYNHFVTSVRRGFWDRVFEMSDFGARMTSRVKTEFEKFCKENNGMEFTTENIRGLLGDLMLSTNKISEQCVIDVFDCFTKYHEENRIHIEGWKTNSQWMANRRIILPYMVEHWQNGCWHVPYKMYSGGQEQANDIDKAMCFLSGKRFEAVVSIAKAIHDAGAVQQCSSEFFDMKWYNKGTLHLYFRDETLWKRFNVTACKGKNWLPDQK